MLARFCLAALLITGPAFAAPAREMDKAFAAAFGHAAPTAGTDGPQKPAKFIYKPSGLVSVVPGLVALISKGKPVGCETCADVLAIHYLKRSGPAFSLVKAWPAIAPAAAWTLRADLDRVPVLVASRDEGGQDCRQSFSQLIALTPDRPLVQANLLMAVRYDPGPEPDRSPGYAVKAKLVPEERGKSFALQYAGTWSLRVEYARKGDVYVAKNREAPACQ